MSCFLEPGLLATSLITVLDQVIMIKWCNTSNLSFLKNSCARYPLPITHYPARRVWWGGEGAEGGPVPPVPDMIAQEVHKPKHTES